MLLLGFFAFAMKGRLSEGEHFGTVMLAFFWIALVSFLLAIVVHAADDSSLRRSWAKASQVDTLDAYHQFLGKIDSETFRDGVVRVANPANEMIKKAVARIGDLELEALCQNSQATLEDYEAYIRRHYRQRYFQCGFAADLQGCDDRHKVLFDTLARIGAPWLMTVIGTLGDKDPSIRRGVAHVLGKMGDLRAVDALISLLHDDDYHVRKAAVMALRDARSRAAVEPLIALLERPDCPRGDGGANLVAEALIAITGEELYSHESWRHWWEKKGKRLPPQGR